MTEEEMTAYLRENGYPEHVIRAGRAGLIERWAKVDGPNIKPEVAPLGSGFRAAIP